MKKTIEKVYCDICEAEAECIHNKFTVYFTTDQTEGRPCKPYLSIETLDVCKDCLEKAITIEASGAQGYNKYHFRRTAT